MVFGLAVGAAAAGGGGLFDYNRKNFLYDRKMRQESEYQIMELRLKQAELWREDVRDIIGLTSVKMDTYLVVNAVQLGFCVMAFCEGRLAAGTPVWLIGCHTLSLAGAFMYLLMSVWLSMHAAVSAKSYEVRILTQLVRLPVPSWTQLEGARTYGSAFEKVQTKQMFRVPFLFGTQEDVRKNSRQHSRAPGTPAASQSAAASGNPGGGVEVATSGAASQIGEQNSQTADPWGLERRGDGIYELDSRLQTDPRNAQHIQIVREAMKYWQSYDAFARVSMSMGTNQLIAALSYYVLGYVLVSNHGVIASWLAVALFMGVSVAIIRLDMSLSAFEFRNSVILVILGPFLSAFATEQWTRHTVSAQLVVHIISPIVYLVHFMWFAWVLQIIKVTDQQKDGAVLPTGFRSVLYMDVFGWIKRKAMLLQRQEIPTASAAPPPSAWAAGTGPAVQAARYEQGAPVPLRPEELPGASRNPREMGTSGRTFDPQSFVPRERGEASLEATGGDHQAHGSTPWLVFHGATVLLATLWILSGGFVLLNSLGVHVLRVQPLLRESVEEEMSNRGWFLQMSPQLIGGEPLVTTWPHANVRPRGLACDSTTNTVASVSRFGLYVSHLDPDHVQFEPAPACHAVQGEALLDVALRCGKDSSDACRALVLHRQGQRLASCLLGSEEHTGVNASAAGESADMADEWLTEDMDEEPTPEEVKSLAFAASCHGGGHDCAYVETSARRIVEVQKSSKEEAGGEKQKWFPTRVLQARASETGAENGGALHLINGKYLGVLLRDKKSVEVLDPSQGGMMVGRWMLPQDTAWDLMCSSGNDLYFLDSGPSPQLWRFPLPQELSNEKILAPSSPKRIQMTAGSVEELPRMSSMRKSLQTSLHGQTVLSVN